MEDNKKTAMQIARRYDLKKADKEKPTEFLYRAIMRLQEEIEVYMSENKKLRSDLVKGVEESDQYKALLDQLKFEQKSHEQTKKELEKLRAITTPESEPKPTPSKSKKGRPYRISPEDRQVIRDKHRQGATYRSLAEEYNISAPAVYKICKE